MGRPYDATEPSNGVKIMLEHLRREHILGALSRNGSIRTEELAAALGVSGMTVRRDLQALEQEGRLRRVHGGAITATSAPSRMRSAPAGPLRATIGMLAPSDSYYFGPVISGAKQAARDLDCRLVLAVSGYVEQLELHQARRLLERGVDGLLVTPSGPLGTDRELQDLVSEAHLPVILVERDLDERHEVGTLESVRTDYVHGARLAVRHLVELGHTSVALALRDSPTAAWVSAGFRVAVQESGLDPSRVIEHDLARLPDHETPALDRLNSLLTRCRRRGISAVIVLTDIDAITLVDLAAERGVRVPDDLAIIAYDDEVAAHAAVPLTAVSPAKRDLGYLAFSMCFDRIREAAGAPAHEAATPHRRIHLLPTLTVRDSTVPG